MLVDDDNKHEIDTNEILCRLMKQQSALEVDIDCFDGNPLNYRYFMAIFKEVVENRIDDPNRIKYQEKKEKYDQKKKVNTFLAKTEIQTNESFKLKAQKEENEYSVCRKSHSIEDCEDFLKLGIEERSKMIFNNKCYGC